MTGIVRTHRTLACLPMLAIAVLGLASLTACGVFPEQAPQQAELAEEATGAPEQVEAEPEEPAGLEETDFGNLTWNFMPGGNHPESMQIEMVDGKATDESIEYTVGEVVLSELNGDDRIDAAVQLTMLDGNGFNEQWYLWIATDDGPDQVRLPVANMARCGTAIHSVTAADEGGVVIHESRRYFSEEMTLSCADVGTDERTRTVSVLDIHDAEEWWPVQTAPVGGFGGLCPISADNHADPYTGQMYAGPDTRFPEVTEGNSVGIFPLQAWPVYGEDFPGWTLVGMTWDGGMSCAWVETP
jgi:hypothetical protein